MMKKLTFLISIFIFFLSFGQKRYSTNEMLKNFPLNKASKVKIISYNIDFIGEFVLIPPPPNKKLDSSQLKNYYDNLKKPIKLLNVISNENFDKIQESKTLNIIETIELSNLLFNTCGKYTNNVRRISMCFFPRNAILFYDENDKIFDFLEICFECDRMEALSEKANEINDMCKNFYPSLEKFFLSKGIQTQYNRK